MNVVVQKVQERQHVVRFMSQNIKDINLYLEDLVASNGKCPVIFHHPKFKPVINSETHTPSFAICDHFDNVYELSEGDFLLIRYNNGAPYISDVISTAEFNIRFDVVDE